MFKRDPLANPEPLIRRVYAYVAYFVGDGPDAEDRLNPPPGLFTLPLSRAPKLHA